MVGKQFHVLLQQPPVHIDSLGADRAQHLLAVHDRHAEKRGVHVGAAAVLMVSSRQPGWSRSRGTMKGFAGLHNFARDSFPGE